MRIVAGTHKNHPIITPKGQQTRPTSGRLRESLFNICQSYIGDARFLDLFAGSGAIGLEAISRGASSAAFIDNHAECIKTIKRNLQALNMLPQALVIEGDVFVQIKKLHAKGALFDIIYADPPYSTYKEDQSFSAHLLKMLDRFNILAPGGIFFLEEASKESLPSEETLQNLILKSSRRMGKSQLLQYQRKENA